jgi:hypothetical protein
LNTLEKQLYFIENSGCDDTTCGLVELSKEELNFLMEIIRNLNQNSTYGCQPIISIYKTEWNNFKEVIPSKIPCEVWEDNYVDKKDIFPINNKFYTFINRYDKWDLMLSSEEIK